MTPALRALADLVKALNGVRLPYSGTAWEELIRARKVLAAAEPSPGAPPAAPLGTCSRNVPPHVKCGDDWKPLSAPPAAPPPEGKPQPRDDYLDGWRDCRTATATRIRLKRDFAKLGEAFHGGGLDGASIYNVFDFAAALADSTPDPDPDDAPPPAAPVPEEPEDPALAEWERLANEATPGPWYVGEDDRNDQATVYGDNGRFVALCPHECVGAIIPEMRANAALIADVPHLVAALRRARGGR